MELPPAVLRQQQQSQPPSARWVAHGYQPERTNRLVAYNEYDHSYSNLAFSQTVQPFTESNFQTHMKHHEQRISSLPTSPTTTGFYCPQQQPQSLNISRIDDLISIKSKIGVEYRRYSVARDSINKFEDFFRKIESMHHLQGTPFAIHYYDQDDELLPINSDGKLAKAIDAATQIRNTQQGIDNNNYGEHIYPYYYRQTHILQRQNPAKRPYLRLFLEKSGIPNSLYYLPSFTWKNKRKDNIMNLFMPSSNSSRLRIGMPEDFRQVSSVLTATATRRRVILNRGCSEKPLGFYIRDGAYLRYNNDGMIENHHGIFISRVVPGGLADSTNLLAENDEILEVNGIEVGKGKRLDQVRDMMIANSSSLIITVRPARPFNRDCFTRSKEI